MSAFVHRIALLRGGAITIAEVQVLPSANQNYTLQPGEILTTQDGKLDSSKQNTVFITRVLPEAEIEGYGAMNRYEYRLP